MKGFCSSAAQHMLNEGSKNVCSVIHIRIFMPNTCKINIAEE